MQLIFLLVCLVLSAAQTVYAAPSASRTSGVVPLSVHFWADVAASTPEAQPFHNYEYSWNFDDPDSGTWGTSGKSKNTDKGPVAAHIYETAGTYTATLTIRDSSGVVGTPTEFEITVADPATVFAGTLTTCVSTGSDFTGCPSGAAQVTTSSLAGLSGYTDAGERVLLRRGDSWTVSSQISFPNNNGPVHIGAFGSCSSADELGICSNAPAVTINTTAGQDGHSFLNQSNKSDWRLADISFTATMGNGYVTSGLTGVKNNLVYRVKADGFFTPLYSTHWRLNDTDYFYNNAYVSSRLNGSSLWLIYVGSERLVVMGNIASNSDQSHTVRLWQSYRAVVSHNIISGAGLNYPSGRHGLKLFGPSSTITDVDAVGTFAETGNNGLRNRTEFVVVANNVIGGSGPWPVSIGPQDNQRDERLSDIIIEKNKMLAGYGQQNPYLVQVGLMFEGRYITARNNIVDGTGGFTGYTGISVYRRGVEWTPLGNRVYNNTVYSQNNHTGGAVGVAVHADAADTVIRNNYISFPGMTGEVLLSDASTAAVASDNVMTDTHYFTDPDNASPLLRDFSLILQATSAINQGYDVPVYDDYNGTFRESPFDIGAFLFRDTVQSLNSGQARLAPGGGRFVSN